MPELELDEKTAGAITALLDKVNGKRKKFKLALDDVTRVVADALASPHGLAVRPVAPPSPKLVVGAAWRRSTSRLAAIAAVCNVFAQAA